MSLIRASRWRAAPSTRSSGSRSCLQRLGILPQHLADADDGVERRAQLMAHVGEELRLVLARLRELAALVLDFAEQMRILDRQRRLGGEGLQQLDRAFREFARRLAPDHECADDLDRREQRHDQARAIAGAHHHARSPAYDGSSHIGDLIGLSRFGREADSLGNSA